MRFQHPVTRVMTEAVLSIDAASSVSEALRLFIEYPVHHLPVVRERKLVGMLSSADVMKLKGFLPKNAMASEEYIDQRFSIETLMSHPAISVQSHQAVEDAARLMVTHAVHALPVVDMQDHLLGIVTTTDMMQALLHGASRPGEEADPEHARTLYLERRVATLEEALRLVRRYVVERQDEVTTLERVLERAEDVEEHE